MGIAMKIKLVYHAIVWNRINVVAGSQTCKVEELMLEHCFAKIMQMSFHMALFVLL